MATKYPKFLLRHYHIKEPIYGAWKMFGWEEGTWGLRLEKHKIDELAENNMSAAISYNLNKHQSSPEYELPAKKIQKFPIHIRKRDNLHCYVVPLFALNKKSKITEGK